MFSGIARHACMVVGVIAVTTGAVILAGGTAGADPQDDKFLSLLFDQDIPPIDNASSLITTAHKACAKLDGGMSVDELVDLIRNNGYNADWRSRLDPPDRVTRTITRFITASVQAYCPYDAGKIASIAAYPGTGSGGPTNRSAAHTQNAVLIDDVFIARGDRGKPSDSGAHGVVLASLIGPLPSGEVPPSNPPAIPAQPAPRAPQEVQPAPQEPPPPPRRVQVVPKQAPQQQAPPPEAAPPAEPPPPAETPPPAAPPAPEPGGGPGAAPGNQPPEQPTPPGHIRLAP